MNSRPVCLAVLLLAAAGCSGGGIKLVPVEGVLKVNGSPAANIAVQFMPDVLNGGEGPTSSAVTDAQGRFQLRTLDGRPGAAVGAHLVSLVDPDEERPAQGQARKRKAKVDPRYASPMQSDLRVSVPESGGPLNLDATAPR